MSSDLIQALFDRIGILEKKVDHLEKNNQRMRIEDLSEYLGRPKKTISDWIYKGLIPYHRDGRPFFIKDEIDEWTRNGGVRGAKALLQDKVDQKIAKHDQPQAA